jgi:hypothetical protein
MSKIYLNSKLANPLFKLTYAEYYGNASQVITAGVTNVPFATKIVDIDNIWKGNYLLVPFDGVYTLDGNVKSTTNITSVIDLYVDGGQYKRFGYVSVGLSDLYFSGMVYLPKNKQVSIRINGAGCTLSNNPTNHTIAITGWSKI